MFLIKIHPHKENLKLWHLTRGNFNCPVSQKGKVCLTSQRGTIKNDLSYREVMYSLTSQRGTVTCALPHKEVTYSLTLQRGIKNYPHKEVVNIHIITHKHIHTKTHNGTYRQWNSRDPTEQLTLSPNTKISQEHVTTYKTLVYYLLGHNKQLLNLFHYFLTFYVLLLLCTQPLSYCFEPLYFRFAHWLYN